VKEFLRHIPSDGGRVIDISSLASEHALPSSRVYSATKSALDDDEARAMFGLV
jgi:short-subunit dehydrogenase